MGLYNQIQHFSFSHINDSSSFLKAVKYIGHRFYYWTFKSVFYKRLSQKKEKKFVYKTKHGFLLDTDLNKIVDQRYYIGEFEADTLSFFESLVQPNMVILDIGANIGIFSLVASKALKNTGQIYAFEPADEPHERAGKNIHINNFNNISLIKKGISDKAGFIEFNICEDDAYNSIGDAPMDKIVKKVKIDVTSIDEFCKEKNIMKVDLIKIDTEGAEFLAIQGGKKLLSSEDAPVIFSEFNTVAYKGFDYKLNEFEDALKSLGYKVFELKYGVLKPFDSNNCNTMDIICFKNKHLKELGLMNKV
jgi:FkbM family methyltransferase